MFLACLGDDFSRKFNCLSFSYVPPLISIPQQPQRNGQASETNAVSTPTEDDLLPSSVTVYVKLELGRTRWFSQATKQYFFDRFLADELNEIGLHKGTPGWKDYVDSALKERILNPNAPSTKYPGPSSFAEVEAAIERRCREKGIPLSGESRFV